MTDLDRMRIFTEAAKIADEVATHYRTIHMPERARGADAVVRELIRQANAPVPIVDKPERQQCKTGCGRSANEHGTWCCTMCKFHLVKGFRISYNSHTRTCTRRHQAANPQD